MPEPTPERSGDPGHPLDGLSDELQERLLRYLDLRIRSLEREERLQREAQRHERMRGEVGRIVTAVLALLVYAGVLGALTRSTLVAALFSPEKLARNLTAAGTITGEIIGLIPEGVRGVILSALGALALLVLRSASLNIRSEVGGALGIGIVTLSLAGLASAAVTTPLGALAALPGLVAAVVLVHELLDVLRAVQGRRAHRAIGVPRLLQERRWGRRIERWLEAGRVAINPTSGSRLRAAYLALVPVALGCVAVAVAVRGGPLFAVGLLGFAGLGAWFAWACALSPAWARIPLWSMVPWALFFFSLLVTGPMAVVFSLAIVITLVTNALLLTLHSGVSRVPPGAGAMPIRSTG